MSTIFPFSSSVQFFSGVKNLTRGPNELKIMQEEYMHDLVIMEFWGGDVDSVALQSGMPVQIGFGRPGLMRNFYGYVNHAKRFNSKVDGDSLIEHNGIRVYCVGASFWMKETSTRSWTNVTMAQVVAQIAAQFKLATDITPDTTVWSNLQMAGRSYFTFLSDCARRIGYTFSVNGVQVVFKPRQTNPNKLKAVAAVFDYRSDPWSLPKFSPVIGAESPGGGQLANRHLAGVDLATGKVVHSSVAGSAAPTILGEYADEPLFTRIEHDTAVSQQEVIARAAGTGSLNQLYITASANAVGNAFISQSSLIFVKNANGGQNGLWFVCKAEHKLDARTYETVLSLGRDSMGSARTITFNNASASTGPAARLLNGNWVAA